MRTTFTAVLYLLGCCASQAQWETLADVPAELTFPVVVALNGEIHVMGGGGTGGATDLHLRYTPATDQWDTLAPVPYSAQQPCGAVVDGKIHFCGGGYPNTGSPLDHHYVYDPSNDTWSAAADLPFPTAINEAVELDGQLYVLSGQPQRDLCQRYDPGTDSWIPNNALPDDDFWYSAMVSNGQTLFRFGGGGYAVPLNLAMVYDKVNDSWSYLPDLTSFRHAPGGCALGDSLVVIAGGYWNGDVADVWLYHVNSQPYSTAPSLPTARSYHSLVSIGACVYSVGGNGPDPNTGVSLIRNCTLAGSVSVEEAGSAPPPYAITQQDEQLTVRFPATASGPINLRLLDALGRMVDERHAGNGGAELTVDGSALAVGRYTIVIRIGGDEFTADWVLKRS